MLFAPFKKATRPETPGFADAAYQQGVINNRNQQQENAARSQTLIGAGELYDAYNKEGSAMRAYVDELRKPTTTTTTTEPLQQAVAQGTESPLITEGMASTTPASAPGGVVATALPDTGAVIPEALPGPAAVQGAAGPAELATASSQTMAAGESIAAIAAEEVIAAGGSAAAAEAAATAALETASTAGGAASSGLALMGPMGWGVLAASALSSLLG